MSSGWTVKAEWSYIIICHHNNWSRHWWLLHQQESSQEPYTQGLMETVVKFWPSTWISPVRVQCVRQGHFQPPNWILAHVTLENHVTYRWAWLFLVLEPGSKWCSAFRLQRINYVWGVVIVILWMHYCWVREQTDNFSHPFLSDITLHIWTL